MNSSFPEKRREPRRPADGAVTLRLIDAPPSQIIHGRLLDVSPHGFRAAHPFPGLVTGQEVHFEYSSCSGRARVAWNRIVAGDVQTGCYILED